MSKTTTTHLRTSSNSEETSSYRERVDLQCAQESYFQPIVVDLPERARVSVTFSDPGHLSQDLEASVNSRSACIAKPNLIVVPRVTAENLVVAVTQLYRNGYFKQVHQRLQIDLG